MAFHFSTQSKVERASRPDMLLRVFGQQLTCKYLYCCDLCLYLQVNDNAANNNEILLNFWPTELGTIRRDRPSYPSQRGTDRSSASWSAPGHPQALPTAILHQCASHQAWAY